VPSPLAILLTASLLASPPVGTIAEGPSPPTAAMAGPLLGFQSSAVGLRVPTLDALRLQPAPTPPGGYWKLGERNAPEPPDGHEAITVGSVMFSLGLLRAAAGGVGVYTASRPELCPFDCRSAASFGWAGVGYGGLILVGGLVTLIVGLAQRSKHERWQRGELTVGPWSTRSHASRSFGFSVGLRF
jgi:hypothetical protein